MRIIGHEVSEESLAKVGFRAEVCGKEIAAECVRVANRVLCDDGVSQRGLVIFGAVGIGKTAFAKALLGHVDDRYEVVSLGGHAAAANFTDEELYYGLFDHDLLLDDIGCEPCYNDFGMKREHVSELVSDWWNRFDRGYFNNLLVATTNLRLEEVDARYGARFVSRLADLCLFWEMPGEDRRRIAYA